MQIAAVLKIKILQITSFMGLGYAKNPTLTVCKVFVTQK